MKKRNVLCMKSIKLFGCHDNLSDHAAKRKFYVWRLDFFLPFSGTSIILVHCDQQTEEKINNGEGSRGTVSLLMELNERRLGGQSSPSRRLMVLSVFKETRPVCPTGRTASIVSRKPNKN